MLKRLDCTTDCYTTDLLGMLRSKSDIKYVLNSRVGSLNKQEQSARFEIALSFYKSESEGQGHKKKQ